MDEGFVEFAHIVIRLAMRGENKIFERGVVAVAIGTLVTGVSDGAEQGKRAEGVAIELGHPVQSFAQIHAVKQTDVNGFPVAFSVFYFVTAQHHRRIEAPVTRTFASGRTE